MKTTEGAKVELCGIRAACRVCTSRSSKMEYYFLSVIVAADPEIQDLIAVIKRVWLARKHCLSFVFLILMNSALIEYNGLVFRGEQLVVTRSLR